MIARTLDARSTGGFRIGPRARRRVLWSLLASIVINVVLWPAAYHDFLFPPTVQEKPVHAPTIRLEHRPVVSHVRPKAKPRPRPHVVPHRHPAAKPHVVAKSHPIARPHPRVRPKARPIAQLPVHAKPRLLRRPHAVATADPMAYSGHLTFTPRTAAGIDIPPDYKTQDNGNAAASNITVYMDFKHAKGAFVPEVQIWRTNVQFLSGPTLGNAVHDIVASLRSDGAQISASKPEPVCGGKRMGWFLSYMEHTDPPWRFEDTLFMAGDTVYRATYSRPDGVAEDARTRRALDTLCPTA